MWGRRHAPNNIPGPSHTNQTGTTACPANGAPHLHGHGTCVEVSEGTVTGIRDSQNPHLASLEFPAAAWSGFLSGIGSPRT
ncbi:uncharacterized protein DUF397 [Nocardiopsis sp. Huas11]|uniref:DUF397 domain-containing protein n=1 Tax=Nocardiopsis sp. Huas11 TaxID=2183912 RepID=UPI000F265F66|nr:DUF397 domain-containing protein [Nocardiopsis sp. Huas11]RKS07192.1 uncharacterized protein DUF397 [Nocardiopsis sp. Huas11]